MHKPTLCTLLYIGLYTGIALFLFPYVAGRLSSAAPFLVGGALLAVVSGLTRACLQEGDCDPRIHTQRIP